MLSLMMQPDTPTRLKTKTVRRPPARLYDASNAFLRPGAQSAAESISSTPDGGFATPRVVKRASVDASAITQPPLNSNPNPIYRPCRNVARITRTAEWPEVPTLLQQPIEIPATLEDRTTETPNREEKESQPVVGEPAVDEAKEMIGGGEQCLSLPALRIPAASRLPIMAVAALGFALALQQK